MGDDDAIVKDDNSSEKIVPRIGVTIGPGVPRLPHDLIQKVNKGSIPTLINMSRKVDMPTFLAGHPVFSLDQAVAALGREGGRVRVLNRLKHHLKAGALRTVTRGVYAVVPPGAEPSQVRPDLTLVAVAVRPEGIFSHHTALELLGVAQSVWHQHTLFTATIRRPAKLQDGSIVFLTDPAGFSGADRLLGTQKVERSGLLVRVTGPERTLVEGFRRPALVGGLEELVASASGFAVLDLGLLEQVLRRYDAANLWAASGWFLERFRATFHTTESMLALCEQHRPKAPQYLARGTRGGAMASRWNLILPEVLVSAGEPDEV